MNTDKSPPCSNKNCACKGPCTCGENCACKPATEAGGKCVNKSCKCASCGCGATCVCNIELWYRLRGAFPKYTELVE